MGQDALLKKNKQGVFGPEKLVINEDETFFQENLRVLMPAIKRTSLSNLDIPVWSPLTKNSPPQSHAAAFTVGGKLVDAPETCLDIRSQPAYATAPAWLLGLPQSPLQRAEPTPTTTTRVVGAGSIIPPCADPAEIVERGGRGGGESTKKGHDKVIKLEKSPKGSPIGTGVFMPSSVNIDLGSTRGGARTKKGRSRVSKNLREQSHSKSNEENHSPWMGNQTKRSDRIDYYSKTENLLPVALRQELNLPDDWTY